MVPLDPKRFGPFALLFLSLVACDVSLVGDAPPGCCAPDEPPLPTPGACTDAEAALGDLDNPVYHLCVAPADLARLDADVHGDLEVPGVLHAQGRSYAVTVEYQGARTRQFPKKSFHVKFDDSDRFRGDPFGDGGDAKGFEDLVLKSMWIDQSLMREALAFAVMERLGGPAPRVGWANLTLNGDYWGLYAVVERVDKRFLRRRFIAPSGGMYKGVAQSAHLDPGSDLSKGFRKTVGEGAPWDDLHALVETLQKTPLTAEAFAARIDPIFPLDAWTRRMTWIAYTQNLDATTQNYYLYREPSDADDGRWRVLPWDSDITFANHWVVERPHFPVTEKHMLVGNHHFSRRLVKVTPLRHAYVDQFHALLDDALSPKAVRPLALALYRRVANDLARDHARWERPSTPAQELAEILDFIDRRPAYLRDQLDALRGDPNLPDPFIDGL